MKLNLKRIKINSRFLPYIFLLLFICILLFSFEYSKYIRANKEYTVIKGNKSIDVKVTENQDNGLYYICFNDAYKYLDGKIFYDNISKKIIICGNNIVKFKIGENIKTVNFEKTKDSGSVYSYFESGNKTDFLNISLDEILLSDNMKKVTDNKYNKIYIVENIKSINTKITKGRVYVRDESGNIIDVLNKNESINVDSYISSNNTLLISYINKDKLNAGFVDVEDVNIDLSYFKIEKKEDIDKEADTKYIVLDSIDKNNYKDYTYILNALEISSKDGKVELVYTNNEIKSVKEKVSNIALSINNRYLDIDYDPDLLYSIIASDEAKETNIIHIANILKSLNIKELVVDFRNTRSKDTNYLTEYILELYTYLKHENIKLTVNVTDNSNIDLERLKNNVNAYIVITYGKRNTNSNVAGTHSSINISKNKINELLALQIKKSKIILEIPTYSILWTQKDGKIIDAKIYSISAINSFVKSNNAKISVDKNTLQNYVEIKKGVVTYKMWLEDEEEIKRKISLVKDLDLNGISLYKSIYLNDDIINSIK